MAVSEQWTAASGETRTLAAFLREQLQGLSWADAKRLVTTAKVRVSGEVEMDPGRRLTAGEQVELRRDAPAPRPRGAVRIVHDDAHVVVIDKPAGIMSVPFERGDRGTAIDLVREAWRRRGHGVAPIHVVHRLDKDTSGLLVFARSRLAETGLARLFRAHDIERAYTCVAHGDVQPGTLESMLVEDRGDGLRGSSSREGKRAVTRVRPTGRLLGATLCEVRLETGRTHQIRIHLSEAGHPLVGETVYIRDWLRAGCHVIACERLLLHAALLGFRHPVTGEILRFESALPPDFEGPLARLVPGVSAPGEAPARPRKP